MKKIVSIILVVIISLALMPLSISAAPVETHRGEQCVCGGNMIASNQTMIKRPPFKTEENAIPCIEFPEIQSRKDQLRYYQVWNTWRCPDCGLVTLRSNTGVISIEKYCPHGGGVYRTYTA